MLTVILVTYAIVSTVIATFVAIMYRIESTMDELYTNIVAVLLWVAMMALWPIILIIALVQGLMEYIKERR